MHPAHERPFARFLTISVTYGALAGALFGAGITVLILFAPTVLGLTARELSDPGPYIYGPLLFVGNILAGGLAGLMFGIVFGVLSAPFAVATSRHQILPTILHIAAALIGGVLPFAAIYVLSGIFIGFQLAQLLLLAGFYPIPPFVTALLVSQIVVTIFVNELHETHPTPS